MLLLSSLYIIHIYPSLLLITDKVNLSHGLIHCEGSVMIQMKYIQQFTLRTVTFHPCIWRQMRARIKRNVSLHIMDPHLLSDRQTVIEILWILVRIICLIRNREARGIPLDSLHLSCLPVYE